MADVGAIRREVCALHAELVANGLVAWTSGNVSARVPGEELMVIKASGVPYDELTPEAIVVCDLDGGLVDGSLAPSSDAETHGYVYRTMPAVGGHRAHAQRVRDGVGGARRADPVRAHRDGRRVRRRDPARAVRADRHRRDRARDRRHARRAPLAGGAPARPRRVRARRRPARRGQGRRDVRGRGADGAPRARARRGRAARAGEHRRAPRRATRTSTGSAERCAADEHTRTAPRSACSGSCRASTTTCCPASPSARPRTPPSSPPRSGTSPRSSSRRRSRSARTPSA